MNKKLIIYLNVVLFSFIFLCNYFYPLNNDDLNRLVSSIDDHSSILHKVYSDYYTWTGRLVAQVLIYLVMYNPLIKLTFFASCLMSSACYVYLNNEIYQYIFSRKSQRSAFTYLLFSFLFILYYNSVFGFKNLIAYKTVSVQYLWGITFSYWLIKKIYIENLKSNASIAIILFIIGVIIGTYNEVLNLLFMLSIICIIFHNKTYKNLNLSHVLFFIGQLVGFIVMILSPGTAHRKALSLATQKELSVSLIDKIKFVYINYFSLAYGKIILLVIIVWLFLQAYRNNRLTRVNEIKLLIILWVISLFMLFPFAYYYEGGVRGSITIFPDVILFILVFMLFINNYNWQKLNNNIVAVTTCMIFMFMFLSIAITYKHYCFNQSRIQQIIMTTNSRNIDFTFTDYNFELKSPILRRFDFSTSDLYSSDPKSYKNDLYAQYYGAKSVREISR